MCIFKGRSAGAGMGQLASFEHGVVKTRNTEALLYYLQSGFILADLTARELLNNLQEIALRSEKVI